MELDFVEGVRTEKYTFKLSLRNLTTSNTSDSFYEDRSEFVRPLRGRMGLTMEF